MIWGFRPPPLILKQRVNRMYGDLANVSVGGMVRLLSMYRQTGKLKVRGENGEGEMYLAEGQVVGTDKNQGEVRDNVLKLLLLKKGTFHFEATATLPIKKYPKPPLGIENLILEASRSFALQDVADYLPGQETVLQLAPITVDRERIQLELLRDEWNLLTRVNGEDSIGLVMEKSGFGAERSQQIIYGLLSAGLIRKTRFRIPKIMEIATRELGNLGEALVRQAFRKLKLDQSQMHMRQLIDLLNELERNITLLLGPTRAGHIISVMWEGAKR